MTDATDRPGRARALFIVVAAAALSLAVLAGEPPPEKAEDASEEKAESQGNRLAWSTASEVDNFGYDVYRGESEDGPFERITPEPILGAGTTDEPSHYELVDRDVDPYATYWYYVESISKRGDRERFTPVFRKKPRLERDDGEPEAESEAGAGDPDR